MVNQYRTVLLSSSADGIRGLQTFFFFLGPLKRGSRQLHNSKWDMPLPQQKPGVYKICYFQHIHTFVSIQMILFPARLQTCVHGVQAYYSQYITRLITLNMCKNQLLISTAREEPGHIMHLLPTKFTDIISISDESSIGFNSLCYIFM